MIDSTPRPACTSRRTRRPEPVRRAYPQIFPLRDIWRWLGFAPLLILGVAVQVWAAIQWQANFDSDEATFGLMARHTLQGNPPIYMYGIRYLGSVEALLSAQLMRLLGESVLSLRLSSIVLFGSFLILHTVLVARLWSRLVAWISLLALALPYHLVLWWTYRPIGGFGAMFVCGSAALLLSQLAATRRCHSWSRMLALGALLGVGVWSQPMTIVYASTLGVISWLRMPEWAILHQRLSAFRLPRTCSATSQLLGCLTVGCLMLLVVAFFTGGCKPPAALALLQTAARLLLAGVGAAVLCLLVLISNRRRQMLAGAASLAAGFLVGSFPLWKALVFDKIAPESAIRASCPSETVLRVKLIVDKLLPAIWGLPNLHQLVGFSLARPIGGLLVLLVMLVALGWFCWTQRRTIRSLVMLTPLAQRDQAAAIPLLLFALPLLLAVLGSNTIDMLSARYLLISWQASSIILAILLAALVRRSRILGGALIAVWCLQIGISNVTSFSAYFDQFRGRYAPEATTALEHVLASKNVRGGYASYWDTYTIDFLTQERLTLAPYDGIDRYPMYTDNVDRLAVRAYIFSRGELPARPARIDDLTRALHMPRNGLAVFPGIVRRLRDQVVLERTSVGRWDVWIVADRRS